MIRVLDIEWWNEIFQSLGRNRRRSIFTALGVVWGTFMLVLLLGVGMGLSDIVTGEMADNASNTTYMFSHVLTADLGTLQGDEVGKMVEYGLP